MNNSFVEFQRFLDNHEYRTNVAVTNLFFEVTVYRALLVEEDRKEQIAKETIAWGAKLPSLAETLTYFQSYVNKRDAGVAPITNTSPPATANSQPPTADGSITSAPANPVAFSLDDDDPQELAAYRTVMAEEGATIAEKLQRLCTRGSAMLFTRPPLEDFIPPHDEVNVVDPPQEPTPLTIAMLRDHRNKNLPSTKMHFGLALGTIVQNPMLARQVQKASGPANKKKSLLPWRGKKEGANNPSDEVEMIRTAEDGTILPSSETPTFGVNDCVFSGGEVILASVDHVSENVLHCKPSLVDEHTCHVDSTHIYTFTISLSDKDPNAAPVMASSKFRTAVMVKMFAGLLKNTLRASRRFEPGALQTQANEERNNQILLKQAIMNQLQHQHRQTTSRGLGSGKVGHSTHAHGTNASSFTPAPEVPGTMRLHVMGVIESVFNIPQDSLFVRYRFLLPDGCVEDKQANLMAGLPPSLAGPITSQLAWASRIRDEDYILRTMHTFNLPLELHATLPVTSTTPVRLIMSFYSKGSGGDYFQTAEGYAQQTMPMFAGSYNFEVLLWRPKPTAYEYLKSVFIGGSPRLADEEDVAIPAHVMDGYASRAGLQTESTGWVKLKINIISHMKPETDVDDRLAKKAAERAKRP